MAANPASLPSPSVPWVDQSGRPTLPFAQFMAGEAAQQNLQFGRATVTWNGAGIGSGVLAFSIPGNAYIMAIDLDVTTAFNASTGNHLTIGVTPTGADFLASTPLGTAGVQHMTSAAGLGLAVTGVSANQTAANKSVPVYMQYTQTGTAATAGSVTVIITYATAVGAAAI